MLRAFARSVRLRPAPTLRLPRGRSLRVAQPTGSDAFEEARDGRERLPTFLLCAARSSPKM
jgi:hypothetical protein